MSSNKREHEEDDPSQESSDRATQANAPESCEEASGPAEASETLRNCDINSIYQMILKAPKLAEELHAESIEVCETLCNELRDNCMSDLGAIFRIRTSEEGRNHGNRPIRPNSPYTIDQSLVITFQNTKRIMNEVVLPVEALCVKLRDSERRQYDAINEVKPVLSELVENPVLFEHLTAEENKDKKKEICGAIVKHLGRNLSLLTKASEEYAKLLGQVRVITSTYAQSPTLQDLA